jgi:hypothetical protein
MEEDFSSDNTTDDFDEDVGGDEFNYSRKAEFQKAQIVQEAINRCSLMRAKDMRAGYYNIVFDKNGGERKVYIDDGRKVFVSAIKSLKCLLTPELKNKGAEEFKAKMDELDRKEVEAFNRWCYEERKWDGKQFVGTGRRYMPAHDAQIETINFNREGGKTIKYLQGYWNNYVNNYWDEMLLIADDKFALLNELLEHIGYYKPVTMWG